VPESLDLRAPGRQHARMESDSFVPLFWLGVALLVFGCIALLCRAAGGPAPQLRYCKRCGQSGRTTNSRPGSNAVELLLWLGALAPGLFYTLWRNSRVHAVCAGCGSAEIIPVDSPLARQMGSS